jgi:hypothetical protein
MIQKSCKQQDVESRFNYDKIQTCITVGEEVLVEASGSGVGGGDEDLDAVFLPPLPSPDRLVQDRERVHRGCAPLAGLKMVPKEVRHLSVFR